MSNNANPSGVDATLPARFKIAGTGTGLDNTFAGAVVLVDPVTGLSAAPLAAGEDLSVYLNGVPGVQHVITLPKLALGLAPKRFDNNAVPSGGSARVTNALVASGNTGLLSLYATNINAALRYLVLFDKGVLAPVAGTDVPVAGCVWPIPAGTAAAPGVLRLTRADFADLLDFFANGLAWAISTTTNFAADSATATDHFLIGRYWTR